MVGVYQEEIHANLSQHHHIFGQTHAPLLYYDEDFGECRRYYIRTPGDTG